MVVPHLTHGGGGGGSCRSGMRMASITNLPGLAGGISRRHQAACRTTALADVTAITKWSYSRKLSPVLSALCRRSQSRGPRWQSPPRPLSHPRPGRFADLQGYTRGHASYAPSNQSASLRLVGRLSWRRLVCGHKFRRPRQPWQRHSRETGPSEIKAGAPVLVNERLHELRRAFHQMRSHSLPFLPSPESCACGLPITTSISPCGLIL